MLIRRPVSEVFEAVIDPVITSHFWFTKGSGRLAVGKPVKWEWEMHNMSNDVTARTIEPNKLIVMEWPGYSGPTTVTWKFREVESGTFLEVEETGWTGTSDELVKYVCDSAGGFTWVLAGMKAWLEHRLELNLVADRFPKELGGH
ncbi:MAG: SRPBCC family protein [Pseudorhizobium sp.]